MQSLFTEYLKKKELLKLFIEFQKKMRGHLEAVVIKCKTLEKENKVLKASTVDNEKLANVADLVEKNKALTEWRRQLVEKNQALV